MIKNKLYLFLVLLALFAISVNKNNKTYAFEIEDLVEFARFTRDNGIQPSSNNNSDVISNRNFLAEHANQLYTAIQNQNIDLTRYNTFLITFASYPTYCRIICLEFNDNTTFTITNNKTAQFSNIVGQQLQIDLWNDNTTHFSASSPTTYYNATKGVSFTGLTYKNPNTYGSYILQQRWQYIKAKDYTGESGKSLPIEVGTAFAGNAYTNTNVTFKMYNEENEEQNFNYAYTLTTTQYGTQYTIYLNSSSTIKTNNYYYLTMEYNNVQMAKSETVLLMFSSGNSYGTIGEITNASGEVWGNIDLSGIEGQLSDINNTIISGDNKIIEQLKQNESGDKQRFDYWVGFFNPSGDNVSNNIINSSGDIFGISYENIDDYGILNFVLNLFNSLYQVLFNNTSDVLLNMGMFGTLNSADFTINNSEISNFLSQVLNPTVILITIFFYYRFIKNVVTLNLDVLDKYDIDNNIKLF